MDNVQPIPSTAANSVKDPGHVSGGEIVLGIIGTIGFIFFGLFYWWGISDSGIIMIFRRLHLPEDPWKLFYAHFFASLLMIRIIYSSNFIQAIAYQISILPKVDANLKKVLTSKEFFEKNRKGIVIGAILLFFVFFAGYSLLDMIGGTVIPKTGTFMSIFLAVFAFFLSKIKHYAYVKPKPLATSSIAQKHLVWETYKTPGKVKLGSDQYAYQEIDSENFKLIKNNHDIEVSPMSRVFFIQPDLIDFKDNKLDLGVGSIRGNVMFDAEIRLNETYLPPKITEFQLSFLRKIFASDKKAFKFIKDNINEEDLEAAQAAAGARMNLINNYFLNNMAAIDDDTLTILDRISDLAGYKNTINKMRSQVRSKLKEMLGSESDQLIKFNFNITDDGTNEKEIVEKIEKARSEARRVIEGIVGKFVDAITARLSLRGGNIDAVLVQRVSEIIGNLTGKPTHANLLEAKRQIKTENETAKKSGLKDLGELEELKDA